MELGVKFKSAAAGRITAIRFYKALASTSRHAGNLWSKSGTLLASVNFNNETASGWQQATLSNPVTITAGTIYVASYHTTIYSRDDNYFNNPTFIWPVNGSGKLNIRRQWRLCLRKRQPLSDTELRFT